MQRSSTYGKHAAVVNEFQGTRTLLLSQWTRTHRSASEKCLFYLAAANRGLKQQFSGELERLFGDKIGRAKLLRWMEEKYLPTEGPFKAPSNKRQKTALLD